MKEITSLQNPIIKEIAALHQKKNRQESGLFIIEGFKGVKDALDYGLEVTHIFLNSRVGKHFCPPSGTELYLVNEKVLNKISTTDTPCDVLAVARQFNYELKDLVRAEQGSTCPAKLQRRGMLPCSRHFIKDKNPLIIVLDSIKDPGNLGTVIRTAKATGASGIVLTGESADIFNPKVVRSSAGNLWKIPVVVVADRANLRKTLENYGNFQFISAEVTDENAKSCFEANFTLPTVVMFGSEAGGISPELSQQADFAVKIPMDSEVESLNLGVSVGVVLYETLRQRM